MQEVIPEKIVRGSLGLEIGCGGGWDTHIMAKGNPSIKFISMDISDGVYLATEVNQNLKKCLYYKGVCYSNSLKGQYL